MHLSIIVVSYNTLNLLKQCLSSVYNTLVTEGILKETEVIVVDNASTDGSCEMVKKEFPQVKLIINEKNLGFAKANNQAVKVAKGEYVLLLNSDTKVKESAFLNLLKVSKKGKNIGVVGGKLLDRDDSTQASCGFFPHLTKVFLWMSFLDDFPFISRLIKPYHVEERGFYQKRQEIDWVSGACLMFRKDIIDKVGFLDEKIFMYGEEVEWCYRVKKEGFAVLYTPGAEIYHYKGGSSGRSEAAGIDQEFVSLIYFYKKHKPFWQLLFLKAFLMFGALLRIVLFGIIRRYRSRIVIYAKTLKMVGR